MNMDHDQFGFTRAQRIEQFTVRDWTPATPYTVRRKSASSWHVIAPNGSVQDCCRYRREAVKYASDRNTHARWAYEGGRGHGIPETRIRFALGDNPAFGVPA